MDLNKYKEMDKQELDRIAVKLSKKLSKLSRKRDLLERELKAVLRGYAKHIK